MEYENVWNVTLRIFHLNSLTMNDCMSWFFVSLFWNSYTFLYWIQLNVKETSETWFNVLISFQLPFSRRIRSSLFSNTDYLHHTNISGTWDDETSSTFFQNQENTKYIRRYRSTIFHMQLEHIFFHWSPLTTLPSKTY